MRTPAITEHSESSDGDPSRVSARQALRELVALSVHGVEHRPSPRRYSAAALKFGIAGIDPAPQNCALQPC
jgi:hypothetical protein